MFDVVVQREPDNAHDPNAVKVQAALTGDTLGYLPRDRAGDYQRSLIQCAERGLVVTCHAAIYGGTDYKPHIGIWLDLAFPERITAFLNGEPTTESAGDDADDDENDALEDDERDEDEGDDDAGSRGSP